MGKKYFKIGIKKIMNDKLLIYFGGTHESAFHQLKYFYKKVDANHHIYIRGLGADYFKKKQFEGDYTITRREIKTGRSLHKSTDVWDLHGNNHNISLIEPHYSNGADISGYDNDDVRIVVEALDNVLEDEFTKLETIQSIVFCGHSRGAAVALFRYLFDLGKKAFLKNKEISVLFLDPVAGQSGNKYYKPLDCTKANIQTAYLYEQLAKLENVKNIVEVYARAAHFMSIPGLGTFNPPRRFMYSHQIERFARFCFTFTHSAMVDPETDLWMKKEDNNHSYTYISKLINDCLAGENISNKKELWRELFQDLDDATLERGKEKDIKGRRKALYKNLEDTYYPFLKL